MRPIHPLAGFDDMETGRVLSFQFGVSHETSTRDRLGGTPLPDTSGSAVLLHPTVTVGLNTHLWPFGLTSVPVSQTWRNLADEQQCRAGFGAILTFE